MQVCNPSSKQCVGTRSGSEVTLFHYELLYGGNTYHLMRYPGTDVNIYENGGIRLDGCDRDYEDQAWWEDDHGWGFSAVKAGGRDLWWEGDGTEPSMIMGCMFHLWQCRWRLVDV